MINVSFFLKNFSINIAPINVTYLIHYAILPTVSKDNKTNFCIDIIHALYSTLYFCCSFYGNLLYIK